MPAPSVRAMILAAGFGTRLGKLSQRRPKPMLPICGAPLVRWAVLWLRAQGVRELVINLHHLGEQIVAELGDGSQLGVNIAYSDEREQILGTGGGLRHARHLLDDGRDTPIVVVNGKILCDLELAPVLAAHRRAGHEATMVLRSDAEGHWGAALGDDGEGRLTTFLGRTRAGAPSGPPRMFTGIHLLQPRFLDRVPAQGEQCIVQTAYRELFEHGEVGAQVHGGYWWEHSTPQRYLQGIANVLSGRAQLPWAERPPVSVDPSAQLGRDVELREPVFIGPGAEIGERAVIGPFTQIGAKAVVEAGVCVERSAVWPGARVAQDLREQVSTG